jgi:hypothetical protein
MYQMISTQKPKSLRFRIVPATVKSSDGKDIQAGRVEWLGESSYTADDLCKPDKGTDGSALEEAVEFLKEVLAEGAMPSKDVKAEAKEDGISIATLIRAKKALGIKPQKGSNRPIYAALTSVWSVDFQFHGRSSSSFGFM